MKRQEFLTSFLGALGAKTIIWSSIELDKIFGTVVYDQNDPEERQNFVWYMTEDRVPSKNTKTILDFLSQNRLIDIDKIVIPIDQIHIDFIVPEDFEDALNELFGVEVKMVDNGVETDSYFLHT